MADERNVRFTEPWCVRWYNELDDAFGYNPGAATYMYGLDMATAKSIARHKNKRSPEFVYYWAEEEKYNFRRERRM